MNTEYRPFNDKDECFKEMTKHSPFGWVRHFDGRYLNLTEIDDYGVNIAPEIDNVDGEVNQHGFGFLQACCIYTFVDTGTPFGIKK